MKLQLRAVRIIGVYADRMELRCTDATNYSDIITAEAEFDSVLSAVSSVTLDRAGVKVVLGYKGVVPTLEEEGVDRLYDISMTLLDVDASQMRYVYRVRKLAPRPVERCEADEPAPDEDDVKAIVHTLLNDADIALRDVKRMYARGARASDIEPLSELVDALKRVRAVEK